MHSTQQKCWQSFAGKHTGKPQDAGLAAFNSTLDLFLALSVIFLFYRSTQSQVIFAPLGQKSLCVYTQQFCPQAASQYNSATV